MKKTFLELPLRVSSLKTVTLVCGVHFTGNLHNAHSNEIISAKC